MSWWIRKLRSPLRKGSRSWSSCMRWRRTWIRSICRQVLPPSCSISINSSLTMHVSRLISNCSITALRPDPKLALIRSQRFWQITWSMSGQFTWNTTSRSNRTSRLWIRALKNLSSRAEAISRAAPRNRALLRPKREESTQRLTRTSCTAAMTTAKSWRIWSRARAPWTVATSKRKMPPTKMSSKNSKKSSKKS